MTDYLKTDDGANDQWLDDGYFFEEWLETQTDKTDKQ